MKKLYLKLLFSFLSVFGLGNVAARSLTIDLRSFERWGIEETINGKELYLNDSKLTIINPQRFSISTNSSFIKITIEEAEKFILLINSNYGEFKITEAVLIELILHPAMQRLRYVMQYGVSHFVRTKELYDGRDLSYNRFEHSIGVFLITRMAGGSIEEQVAALLHDIIHTAFSHVGDYLFGNGDTETSGLAYHDLVFVQRLEDMGIDKILRKYGLNASIVSIEQYPVVKQKYPNPCADNLDFIIQGSIRSGSQVDPRGQIENRKVPALLRQLKFNGTDWYVEGINSARKLGYSSLYLTEHVSGSPWNPIIYDFAASALRLALEINLITKNEVISGTDYNIWNKLMESANPEIRSLTTNILRVDQLYTVVSFGFENKIIKVKFRGIDPLVKTHNGLERLSEIDPEFSEEYYRVKNICVRGWPVQLSECI